MFTVALQTYTCFLSTQDTIKISKHNSSRSNSLKLQDYKLSHLLNVPPVAVDSNEGKIILSTLVEM